MNKYNEIYIAATQINSQYWQANFTSERKSAVILTNSQEIGTQK